MNIAGLWRRLHESKLRDTAHRVARQCEREIVALVAARARTMSEPQARGYIKARAGLIVEKRLREAIAAGRAISADRYARLESIALDALCVLVQSEISSRRLVPLPVRKAA